MVAAVSSLEHMTGKLAGVGLVGLVQYAAWLAAAAVVLAVKAVLGGGGPDLAGVGAGTFVAFAVFFVLGYVLYGTLYAALSAPASRPEDGTILGQPLMLTLVAGFAISFTAIDSPDSGFVTVVSFVPTVSPMVMFTRAALGSPPLWQVLLSIAIVVLTIALAIRLLAKVYRAGILLYGKRPGPREVLRMLRAA
jgi:ABC-2 type transport system permease protein